ncbi:hypothetical protein JXI42_05015 [bacterium]|nr:hypothetical protein [bacterium]
METNIWLRHKIWVPAHWNIPSEAPVMISKYVIRMYEPKLSILRLYNKISEKLRPMAMFS